jgi:hypothetical protein
MCSRGSCCSANVLIKKCSPYLFEMLAIPVRDAHHTGSRLCAVAFTACCYIGSSALRLATLPICYFKPIMFYTTNRNFGFNKKITD